MYHINLLVHCTDPQVYYTNIHAYWIDKHVHCTNQYVHCTYLCKHWMINMYTVQTSCTNVHCTDICEHWMINMYTVQTSCTNVHCTDLWEHWINMYTTNPNAQRTNEDVHCTCKWYIVQISGYVQFVHIYLPYIYRVIFYKY